MDLDYPNGTTPTPEETLSHADFTGPILPQGA
jgi:hypothetical protein